MNWLLKNRHNLAIAFLMSSGSLNYLLRDGVGLAPNNIVFTFLFIYGLVFINLLFWDFKTLYFNNALINSLVLAFFSILFIYMYVHPHIYAPSRIFIYDSFVIISMLIVMLYLSTIHISSVNKNALIFSAILSTLACVGLLLFFAKNPQQLLQGRLAIAFGDGSEIESMGNPHIYGRGALMGFIPLVLLYYNTKSSFAKIIISIAALISFAVIILSQAMSTILATFMFLGLFTLANLTLNKTKNFILKYISKWYIWLGLIVIIGLGGNKIQKNKKYVTFALEKVTKRIENLTNSILGGDEEVTGFKKHSSTDQSADGRIAILGTVQETLVENIEDGNYSELLIGNGYYALYVDVPIVESFHSFGLFGLLLFLGLFGLLTYSAVIEMFHPSTLFNQFVAYLFIYAFVFTFTNGLIIDNVRWGFFILAARFLSIPKLKIN